MEPNQAIEIVQKLADGVDPFSGERFAADTPYQQADTVRALHLALEGLAKLKRSTARKTGPGRPWSEDEEKRDQGSSELRGQALFNALRLSASSDGNGY